MNDQNHFDLFRHSHRRVPPQRRGSPSRVSRALILILVGVACLAAGCSSSPSQSTSASANTAGAASTGSVQKQVTAAEQATAQAQKAPTSIGVSEPLKYPAPSGKTFVFLQCDLQSCAQFAQGIAAAAKSVKWNFKVIDYTSTDPSTLISGFKQALQYHPVAVALSGVPEAVWASAVEPEYKAAGVPIIGISIGMVNPSDPTILGQVSSLTDFQDYGTMIANWFIADSDGNGKALVVDVPSYDVFQTFTQQFVSSVKANCADCSTQTLTGSVQEVANGALVPAVVSAVQSDKSIKYVISCDGEFTLGLATALKSAGISDVKIAGAAPGIANEQNLLNGTESAWAGQNYSYNGWQAIDVALRHLEKMDIPANDGGSPQMLLTKTTVGTPSNEMPVPVGYQTQFEKLWGIG
jgi:ribose transport system substrate-binding protein